jgi:hypothetical protein
MNWHNLILQKWYLLIINYIALLGHRNYFSCHTIKQLILIFILVLCKHVYIVIRLTHNIHLIPLLRTDETYNLIIISYEFKKF